jgi:hypothetical protein
MRAVEALPVEGLANYGLLGIVLGVLFTFAWIAYKDARDRADKCAAEVARLNMVIQESTIPALLESQRALKEAADQLLLLREQRRP